MTEYRCEAICIKNTGQALLVEIDGEEVWLPQTLIHIDSEVFDAEDNSAGTLVIPEWLAKEKGLL